MSNRFATNLLLLELAGFLIVACFAFAPAVVGWLGLGTGCAATLIALTGFALSRRGGGQRVLDVFGVIVAGWLIVASRAFGSETVKWLCFSAADALVVSATLGLILSETARVAQMRALAAATRHDGDGHVRLGFSPRRRTGPRSGAEVR